MTPPQGGPRDVRSHLGHTGDELLVVLIEECAEVQKAIAKLLRHGGDCHNPNDPTRETNIEALHRELGDLAAVRGLLEENGLLDPTAIQAHRDSKLATLTGDRSTLHYRPIRREPNRQAAEERGVSADGR